MKNINTIFIIDDDPITVYGIKKILHSVAVCHHIFEFKNGQTAIDEIRKIIIENSHLPELIFLDINMPVMDGWEFLEAFISLPISKNININIVTSSIDQYDKEKSENFKSLTHHRIAFNSKPIRRSEIEEITKAI
ncbi:CheY chemotaxis protein or a CheY-like REC (receiver) domain [Arenibacter nanhaiticus]|uniref:CheY chemotaxis protein or a CheY-like REC (Receiver) domain n=1 Tax=Arenibacter nanhaiticus TaxID=558155 RepID=A0A1M6HWK9_9FLAO|nr:response regulator [Arenibacter nanhaiticus]SHJ26601.1 CheY chemotaxis protein or a CheY-like REC (receiver) domain [Arenibacter nanhaiticus]